MRRFRNSPIYTAFDRSRLVEAPIRIPRRRLRPHSAPFQTSMRGTECEPVAETVAHRLQRLLLLRGTPMTPRLQSPKAQSPNAQTPNPVRKEGYVSTS